MSWTPSLPRWKGRLPRLRGSTLMVVISIVLAVAFAYRLLSHVHESGTRHTFSELLIVAALACLVALAEFARRRDARRERQARAAAETAAQITLRQYATALNNMRHGVIMLGPDERFIVCNDAYINMYGLSRDIIKPGCSMMEALTHRASLGHFDRPVEEIYRDTLARVATGKDSGWVNTLPDGRSFEIRNFPMAGGGWLTTHEDVTEKLRYEKELADSRAKALAAEREANKAHDRMREAFNVVPEALALFDAQDRLVLWNQHFADLHDSVSEIPLEVGRRFEDSLRESVERGGYPEAIGREEDWLNERLAQHALPQSSHEQRIGDRWLRVHERRTADGGSVGVRIDITELKNREASFRLLFDSNPMPMFIYELGVKRIITANESMVWHYGYSHDELKGMPIRELRALADRDLPFHPFTETNGYFSTTRASRHRKADGTEINVVYYSRQLPLDGRMVGLTAVVDVTDRHKALEELNSTREFLNAVLEAVPSAIMVRNAADRRYTLINKAGEEFFGLPRERVIGRTAGEIFDSEVAESIRKYDEKLLAEGGVIVAYDAKPAHSHGKDDPRVINSRRRIVRGADGQPKFFLSVVEDVTEQKRARERIAYLAHHDMLTSLANRASFEEKFGPMIEQAARQGKTLGVMCTDLDRFKEVNDLFGHSVGDELLRQVSARLRSVAGKSVFIARLGGDEFTMLVTEDASPAVLQSLADRLIEIVADPFDIDGRIIRVGLTVGVAVFPTDGTDRTTLLGNADAALYRAKAQGRGSVRFFDAEMDRHLKGRRAIQFDLQKALERGELSLHYQPQALITGEIIGFEALLRWRHPQRGDVPPATFVPLAEETGMIIPIGEWVIREACREAASWPRPLQISLNLSPAQFLRGNLPELILSVLMETGLAPGRLELEITEGVLIGDFARAKTILGRLKSLGVRIAMDDFGTGYSSLSYLQSFPFDKIKIDRAFISNVDTNAQSAAIVRAAIGLGHGLNLPVIAEGVETESQRAFLARENCDEIQGYFIGRPQPIAAYSPLIAAADGNAAEAPPPNTVTDKPAADEPRNDDRPRRRA